MYTTNEKDIMDNNNNMAIASNTHRMGTYRPNMPCVIATLILLCGCSPMQVKFEYTNEVLTGISADRGLKAEDKEGNKIDTMSPSPLMGLITVDNAKVVQ